MKRFIIAAVAATLVLASCGADNTQLDDAPVGQIDDTPSFIMTNVDQFPNIAFRCMGANGLYTTTREGAGALKIVVNDPECKAYNPNIATVVSG